MGIIRVNHIRLHAHHGCMEEEAIIGGHYIVDVELHTDFHNAARHDTLEDTIDYVDVNRIVTEQMAIRSKLIEHVCQRIIDSLKSELKGIQSVRVRLTKLTPPINGDVASVEVEIEG